MLKLAKNSGLTDVVSTDGSNPITTSHNSTGTAQEVKLYIFNDDATKRYTSITIDPTDTTGSDESSYVQLAPDSDGVPGVYQAASSALTVADISTANSGIAFWYKVTTPSVSSSQNKTDIKLTVNATEFAV